MTKKALRFKDDKFDKFWWIEYDGTDFVVNYGKAGTFGKYQLKEFDTEKECEKEAQKLINQKLKKGYKEVSDFEFDNHYYFDDEEIGLHPKTSHPHFREHFTNEDLYYNCGDEETPFGSDEGHDTLYELADTIRKKNSIDFDDFPRYLIENIWDMKYIPVGEIDEDTIKRLIEKDEMNLIQSDMVTYASAFAQIKITGYVNRKLKDNAIKAMERKLVWVNLQGYEFSEISATMIKDLSSFEKYAN